MNKYSINIFWSDQDAGYIAICPEFPGLSSFGDTPEEAMAEAQIALESFIEIYKEDGRPLPEPQAAREYSGQLRVRLPKSLHRQAALMAESVEDTSLNQFILDAIAQRIGAHKGAQAVCEQVKQEVKKAIGSLKFEGTKSQL
jgi:predicted RNase H-like HicB family nuclease